jgi:hypothetical protein
VQNHFSFAQYARRQNRQSGVFRAADFNRTAKPLTATDQK